MTVFGLIWATIFSRLAYLQIYKYDEYITKVISNVQTEVTISAARGSIYDRNMTQLAANLTVWRVFIAPRMFESEEQKLLICENLSKILGVPYGEVLEKANKSERMDETVKKQASDAEAKGI